MEITPIVKELLQDSGTSHSLYESTPLSPSHTPLIRKRKFTSCTLTGKKLTDVIESVNIPQFSSTLNESLLNNFENCHLSESEIFYIDQPNKYFKGNKQKIGITSTSSTPTKQIITRDEDISVRSYGSASITPNDSPLREAQQILYPNIKPTSSLTKAAPNKAVVSLEKNTIARQKHKNVQLLLKQVLSNPIIMQKVLSYLSDGELYRFSQVSPLTMDAILSVKDANQRFTVCSIVCAVSNKENYKITPPASPEKSEDPPLSPQSQTLRHFAEIGKLLKPNQTLTKCPECNKPSIVECDIGHCQNISCRYIFCRLCWSNSSSGYDNFYDHCGRSTFPQRNLGRSSLGDLSNEKCNNRQSLSYRQNSSDINADSGFYSENDSMQSVRRNLNNSIKACGQPLKLLNKRASLPVMKPVTTYRRSSLMLPALTIEKENKRDKEFLPANVKERGVPCSKESKKRLKRLTQ